MLLVTTDSGTEYEVDLEAKTLKRRPNDKRSVFDIAYGQPKIFTSAEVNVGEPLFVYFEGQAEVFVKTSPIVSIKEIP